MFDPDEKAPEEPTPGIEAERERGSLGEDLGEKYEIDATASASEVSTELEVLFWSAVVFANVALLGLSTGTMVLWFLDRARLGAGLLVAGLLGLAFTYRQYRRYADGDYGVTDDGGGGDSGDGRSENDAADDEDGNGAADEADGADDHRSGARND